MSHKRKMVIKKRMLDVPEDKLHQYKESFDFFDRDKSGTISPEEIQKLLKNYGYPMAMEEVKKLVNKIDTDGDGELNFEEFVTLLQTQTIFVDDDESDPLLEAFKSFDKNNDGKIPNQELKFIIMSLGDIFSKEEVEQCFKIFKLDEDGDIEYIKFIEYWRNYQNNKHIQSVSIL